MSYPIVTVTLSSISYFKGRNTNVTLRRVTIQYNDELHKSTDHSQSDLNGWAWSYIKQGSCVSCQKCVLSQLSVYFW